MWGAKKRANSCWEALFVVVHTVDWHEPWSHWNMARLVWLSLVCVCMWYCRLNVGESHVCRLCVWRGAPRRWRVSLDLYCITAVAFTPVFEVNFGSGRPFPCMSCQCLKSVSLSIQTNFLPKMSKKSVWYAFDADVKSKGPLFCACRFDLAQINQQRFLFMPHRPSDCKPSILQGMNNENCLNTTIWQRIHN